VRLSVANSNYGLSVHSIDFKGFGGSLEERTESREKRFRAVIKIKMQILDFHFN